MQTNEPNSNIAEHPTLRRQSKITAFEAARALDEYRRHPSQSVSICLDSSAFGWTKGNPQIPGAGNLLAQEIRLWSETIGRKTVDSLLLCFPFLHLQPYELTEILHALASHFSLSESELRVHRVVTNIDEINSDHIALLKGLGFNHYQIVLSREDLEDLHRLQAVTELIRKYAFSGIGIQIHDSDCLDDLRDHVIDVRNLVSPDFIYIATRPKLLQKDFTLGGGILFDGECELEENCIYMGLEGTSHLQNLVLQNFCTPKRYLGALNEGQLPVNPGPINV